MVDEITLEQLWDMLTMTPTKGADGERLWVAPDQPVPEDRVFGGLLLAQAIVVAGQGVSRDLVPVTLQADFLAGVPITGRNRWRAEVLGEGAGIIARQVTLVGDDGAPLFMATVRLGRVRADLPSYQTAQPRQVVGPESLVDLSVRYAGDRRVPAWWRIRRPVELRHVEPPTWVEVAPERSDEQSLWFRVRGDVVADPLRSAAVIAYVSDMSLVEPVFRNTGARRHAEGSRILSLTHSVVFHRLPDLVDWLQIDVAVRRLSSGRAHGQGEIFADGQHAVSIAQVGLVKLA